VRLQVPLATRQVCRKRQVRLLTRGPRYSLNQYLSIHAGQCLSALLLRVAQGNKFPSNELKNRYQKGLEGTNAWVFGHGTVFVILIKKKFTNEAVEKAFEKVENANKIKHLGGSWYQLLENTS
jgi:hypothetical protein